MNQENIQKWAEVDEIIRQIKYRIANRIYPIFLSDIEEYIYYTFNK